MHLPIETTSLRLRHLTLKDTPKIFAMSQEDGMRAWIPDQVYADEGEAARVMKYLIAQYQRPDVPVKAPLVLGVCLRESDELIGHVGLSACPQGVEIGYAIEAAHQGQGHATAAVRAMVELGLRSFALPCVFGIVARDNAASCRVLEKAGFELVDEATRPLHGVARSVRTYRR